MSAWLCSRERVLGSCWPCLGSCSALALAAAGGGSWLPQAAGAQGGLAESFQLLSRLCRSCQGCSSLLRSCCHQCS